MRELIAWLVAALAEKVGWRCVMEDSGALCVTTAGLICELTLCAGHWASRMSKREVKHSYVPYVPL